MISWRVLFRAAVVTLWVGLGFFVWFVGASIVWGESYVGLVLIPPALATAAVAVLEECGLARVPNKGVVCTVAWVAAAVALRNWYHLTAMGVPETFSYFVLPWLLAFLVATSCIGLFDHRERQSRPLRQ